jgi:hypothetical protein
MTPLVWSWLLVTVGTVGMWMAGRRIAAGWAVAIANETLWIVYAIETGQWGFIAGATVYIAVFTRNWVRWTHEPA